MPPNAKRDSNFVTTLMAVSSVDGVTPVLLYADPITHRLYVDTGITGGIITNFTQLFDAPTSYTSQALKLVRVNSAETGLEFFTLVKQITVSTTAPTTPAVNDLWYDIS